MDTGAAVTIKLTAGETTPLIAAEIPVMPVINVVASPACVMALLMLATSVLLDVHVTAPVSI